MSNSNKQNQKKYYNNSDLKVISSLEKFYRESKNTVLNNAAQGWFFTASMDRHYIGNNKSAGKRKLPPTELKINHAKKIKDYVPVRSAAQTIEFLNEETDIVLKYNKLKDLIINSDPNLTMDSFVDKTEADITVAQDICFSEKALNIVIIGGGITGLYLASSLKNTFGKKANILVLDNRSDSEHFRKIFDREWVTHIHAELVQKYTPPNIWQLLDCFGLGDLAGLPINMMEALFMLSCKELGVHFYFSPNLDFSKLKNSSISFFFDATGGRLEGCEYGSSTPPEFTLNLPNKPMEYSFAGVKQLFYKPGTMPGFVNTILRASGPFHIPYLGQTRILTHLFKITGIPQSLFSEVLDFILPINSKNTFYIWNGVLIEELNHGLVLINISIEEYDILSSVIDNPVNLISFIDNNPDKLNSLNKHIYSLIGRLIELDEGNNIKINPPFRYAPYINLNGELGTFQGKQIFPVGDSYFCGHPKVGNGLWTHLGFINHIVQEIQTSLKS
ncbi:MAG: hypothetical protein H6912_06335 [Kordiimonadaceae bacterium]|nr:hypothetical protein [Kordiimonadaceae bacterium]